MTARATTSTAATAAAAAAANATDLSAVLETEERLAGARSAGLFFSLCLLMTAVLTAAFFPENLPLNALWFCAFGVMAAASRSVSGGDRAAAALIFGTAALCLVGGAALGLTAGGGSAEEGPSAGIFGSLIFVGIFALPAFHAWRGLRASFRYAADLARLGPLLGGTGRVGGGAATARAAAARNKPLFPRLGWRSGARLTKSFLLFSGSVAVLLLGMTVVALTGADVRAMALVFVVCGALWWRGGRAWEEARRHAAVPAPALRQRDPRPPVLLLRSFADDEVRVPRGADRSQAADRSEYQGGWPTLEDVATDVLWARGPVVAIGRPGEALPPVGAAREYVPNDRWQSRVEELVAEAQKVVMVLGKTEGFSWECRRVAEMGALEKLLVVFPPAGPDDLKALWRSFCAAAGRPAWEAAFPDLDGKTIVLAAAVPGDGGSAGGAPAPVPSPRFVTCRWRNERSYRLALLAAVPEAPTQGAGA